MNPKTIDADRYFILDAVQADAVAQLIRDHIDHDRNGGQSSSVAAILNELQCEIGMWNEGTSQQDIETIAEFPH